jgi:acyl-ACP thioesterase
MFAMEERIRFSECDSRSRLSIGSLINYFQDCCNLQSYEDGIDAEFLTKKGLVWILNSWHVEIERLPQTFENITIYTWPYDFKGFFGQRNFKVEDEAGKICAYADSIWTLIDLSTGKPTKPDEEILAGYHLEDPYPMQHEGRKLKVTAEGVLAGELTVQLHHLDRNHHMNNAQYIIEASDYLPADFELRAVRIEYSRQTLLGEKLEIYKTTDDKSVTIIMKDMDGVVHAIIKFDGKTGEKYD